MKSNCLDPYKKYLNDEEVQRLCSILKLRHKVSNLNKIIYHYTSHQGLFGIFASNTLRATNYSNLNDSGEMKYGTKIVKEIIDNIKVIDNNNEKVTFLTNLESVFEAKFMLSNFYVTCFSQKNDLLSQWRAYGSNQGRICIGFQTDELRSTEDNFSIGKVIYNKEEQIKIIRDWISEFIKFIPRVKELLQEEYGDCFNIYYENTSDILLQQICLFKDYAFHEEEEIRAITWIEDPNQNIGKLNFNCNETGIIPYIDIIGNYENHDNGVLPIKEILIGPSRNKHKLFKVIPLLIHKYKYPIDILIRESDIPFED